MYNLSDLTSMSDDQLKDVAKASGIKKFNPEKRQEIIYQILDEQAVSLATQNSNAPKKPKKPAKAKPATENKNQISDSQDLSQSSSDTTLPKKRGRKPKAEKPVNSIAPDDAEVTKDKNEPLNTTEKNNPEQMVNNMAETADVKSSERDKTPGRKGRKAAGVKTSNVNQPGNTPAETEETASTTTLPQEVIDSVNDDSKPAIEDKDRKSVV